jgi:UDP-N-acetylglucosamine 2-epimerase (non-hydrolysing)
VSVLCIVGTRPEVIKMAPVIKALRGRGISCRLLATAQHRHLLDGMLDQFGLTADWDLDAMRENQGLSALVGRILPELETIIKANSFQLVMAQGDTSTVFASALAAYHAGVPFAHVEAGLRSGDLRSPFPEEGNRRLAGVLSRFHFAPTSDAVAALLREGVAPDTVHLVGNTVIDSLLWMASQPVAWPSFVAPLAPGERLVLVTLHRRENFGQPLLRILEALKRFSEAHPEARILYPVHPNPNVLGPARAVLGDRPNIQLVEPLDYHDLVLMLKHAHLVLTDSGGLQEEAPALGKPVLVFRDVTERPEAVRAGGVVLVGSDPDLFRTQVELIWNDEDHYRDMAVPRFPYGDGGSGERIAEIVEAFLPTPADARPGAV